ncbi:hypothetical protein GGD92_23785 [Pseudomonas protegens]|uniref:Uncharacterized protein n=1 Tax=Pseudomonas protegens TaxID=380021 RepID=A0A7G7X5Y1_9PSED|nr:hypothetical protein [Pseudomonas protegens]QNH75376.1 hypothetical protein GGI48_18860 [Pseudomonas protegens]QNL04570.1 hypothetical protein GGD92_23785 [Pseudomonas protegens]
MNTHPLKRLLLAATLLCASQATWAQEYPDNVYFNMGVHNDKGCDAKTNNCIAKRHPGDPADPLYPATWVSDWTMYRVTAHYKNNPPPYSSPPSTLKPADYTVSQGTSYYDNDYVPADGDGSGAMMEHYEKYCLPIFPIKNNNYTCSFVSLGNKAYFLTYPEDRPKDMPACCMFSPMNHPPRRDFIKHLPYSAARSRHLDASVQAYALEIPVKPSPILFGYAFYKQATSDGAGLAPYQHPQSFYFSGDVSVANAPIVSQNYRNWRNEKPDPAKTWDQVAKMCPVNPPDCQLFNPPPSLQNGARPQWNQLSPTPQ